MQTKEEQLTIKADNLKVVEAGMAFNVRLTLTNFAQSSADTKDKEQNIRGCLLIADTLLVTANGAEALTGNVNKNYTDVSYFLEEEDNI
jgi:nucleosome binding factor SPN SPT16 subunit